jgi:hypothetical protein
MGHPNGPHRGGASRTKIALRDALNIYVWQHLRAHPSTWFSAVELARVISEQYICECKPPSCAGDRWGRSNVLAKILQDMLAAGEVVARLRAGAPAPGAREWRWAGGSGPYPQRVMDTSDLDPETGEEFGEREQLRRLLNGGA